jgi:hypothetical protein
MKDVTMGDVLVGAGGHPAAMVTAAATGAEKTARSCGGAALSPLYVDNP